MLKHTQSGFTLLEVLIAFIVLAIGLLGLAGLQATSLRSNTSSFLRSQATFLAYDIADRMRANRQDVIDNSSYDVGTGAPSASGLAQTDLVDWKANLATQLPAGNGTVVRGAGRIFTITVQWNNHRDGSGSTQKFSMTTEL